MASELGVQTIQHTNGTDALTIDASGNVTLASKLLPSGQTAWPAFRVGLTVAQNETTADASRTVVWDKTSGDNCYAQGGMSLASGVITVPVNGIYIFNTLLRVDGIGSGYVVVRIVKNNSEGGAPEEEYIINGSVDSNYDNFTGSGTFKMLAGDTMRVTIFSEADANFNISPTSSFSGSLIAAE